jgi:hypothetical protein
MHRLYVVGSVPLILVAALVILAGTPTAGDAVRKEREYRHRLPQDPPRVGGTGGGLEGRPCLGLGKRRQELDRRYSAGSVACASARRSAPRCRAAWLALR